jgi:hypothetical protein
VERKQGVSGQAGIKRRNDAPQYSGRPAAAIEILRIRANQGAPGDDLLLKLLFPWCIFRTLYL